MRGKSAACLITQGQCYSVLVSFNYKISAVIISRNVSPRGSGSSVASDSGCRFSGYHPRSGCGDRRGVGGGVSRRHSGEGRGGAAGAQPYVKTHSLPVELAPVNAALVGKPSPFLRDKEVPRGRGRGAGLA